MIYIMNEYILVFGDITVLHYHFAHSRSFGKSVMDIRKHDPANQHFEITNPIKTFQLLGTFIAKLNSKIASADYYVKDFEIVDNFLRNQRVLN